MARAVQHGCGVVSGHFAASLMAGLGRALSACRRVSVPIGRVAGAAAGRFARRLRGVEPAAIVIGAADHAEAGLRIARRLLARRDMRLTGGLLWRGVAALSGIGLAAMLVNALSGRGEPSLASLTIPSVAEAATVRDGGQLSRSGLADDGSWVRIVRPVAMFGLSSPELDRQAVNYEAHHGHGGTRRRDDLGFGVFAEETPHLQLRLLVEHGAQARHRSFLVSLAREAAERGISIDRSGRVIAIETRFGAVETADATLSDGASSRPCIAFHRSPDDLPLGLSGWWCGSATRPADRQQLICLIDRIDLVSAGEDRALRTAFSRTELERRPGCAPPRLAASGRKTSWLDADGRAPALKAAVRR